jgi:hypothetical protein
MRKFLAALAVLIVIGVGVVAYPHLKSSVATTATTTTTTTKPAPVYPNAPLTGLPDPSRSALTRSALTVKVENTPQAMPQWGIDQADVVYEEIVNGGDHETRGDLQLPGTSEGGAGAIGSTN